MSAGRVGSATLSYSSKWFFTSSGAISLSSVVSSSTASAVYRLRRWRARNVPCTTMGITAAAANRPRSVALLSFKRRPTGAHIRGFTSTSATFAYTASRSMSMNSCSAISLDARFGSTLPVHADRVCLKYCTAKLQPRDLTALESVKTALIMKKRLKPATTPYRTRCPTTPRSAAPPTTLPNTKRRNPFEANLVSTPRGAMIHGSST
mmetsp:Transcript_13530/g.46767  ORF Transcript_13530/g.46767 Transcript_13530/m.46767 type:complete len:207 (+) Transcript_13530:535-1155(+)